MEIRCKRVRLIHTQTYVYTHFLLTLDNKYKARIPIKQLDVAIVESQSKLDLDLTFVASSSW